MWPYVVPRSRASWCYRGLDLKLPMPATWGTVTTHREFEFRTFLMGRRFVRDKSGAPLGTVALDL